MSNIEHAYLGQRLLERGFKTWALYMFRLINRTPFICEPLHTEMYAQVQDVIDGKTSRLNLNMSPRTGKTTAAELLCAYVVALNPGAQIIYTSFNQDLLSKISKELAAILQHPAYQAMYPQVNRPREESVTSDPILKVALNVLIQQMVATLSEIVILGNSWMLNLMGLLLRALQRKNNKNRSYDRFCNYDFLFSIRICFCLGVK